MKFAYGAQCQSKLYNNCRLVEAHNYYYYNNHVNIGISTLILSQSLDVDGLYTFIKCYFLDSVFAANNFLLLDGVLVSNYKVNQPLKKYYKIVLI